MKKNVLLIAFLLAQTVFVTAQINLEKTYEEAFVLRFKMPVNGEVYFPKMTTSASIFNIYGSNHQILKQIPFIGSASRKKTVVGLAETPNGELRFLTSEYDSSGTNIESMYLSNERGDIIFSQRTRPTADTFKTLSFLRTGTLPDRLMVKTINNTASITNYSISNLNLNNTKTLNTFARRSNLNIIPLELSGEKFYQTDNNDSIFFYHPDLTPWKSFKMPSSVIYSISQGLINTDTLIEIVAKKYYSPNICYPPCSTDSVKLIAVNELGDIVSSVRMTKEGSSIYDNEQIAVMDGNRQMSLYSYRNGLSLLNKYPPGMLFWQNVGCFGKKYILSDTQSDTVRVYNEDHTLWKTFILPISPNFYPEYFPKIIVFDNSSSVYLVFKENYFVSSTDNTSNIKVINENGDELLKVTDANQYALSMLDGLPFKLLVYGKANWTKVYGFTTTTAVLTVSEKLTAQAFPNPFDKTLTIKMNAMPYTTSNRLNIKVFDITGKQVLSKTTAAASEIPLPEATEWSKGFYLLQIMDDAQRQAVIKIVKN